MAKKTALLNKKVGGGKRFALVKRQTRETDIKLSIDLDGTGRHKIDTGIGFFDHMLESFSKHSAIDIEVSCKGDTHVDDHHSVEDVGIALGQALAQALCEKAGIRRFGFASVPLDEALAQVTIDLSGRAYFVFRGREKMTRGKVGSFDVDLIEDFLYAFASASGSTIHVDLIAGRSDHHMIEATFKALARALRHATELDDRITGIPSTKGVL